MGWAPLGLCPAPSALPPEQALLTTEAQQLQQHRLPRYEEELLVRSLFASHHRTRLPARQAGARLPWAPCSSTLTYPSLLSGAFQTPQVGPFLSFFHQTTVAALMGPPPSSLAGVF